ncbi:hypothetical protein F4779DRAFT_640739 [Xylariaceae sp. FL0662B]|nr:hypothetical protein F4779DRAFT_640739 [Xylariaceae sp. FL0662B]
MGIFKPAPNSPRPKTAHPSSGTSAPSIRGKISGPIPMDDEFPMRQPGTGIAHEGRPRPLESLAEDKPTSLNPGNTSSEVTREDKTDSGVTPSGPSQASNVSNSPQRQRRTAHSSTLRYSTVSEGTGTGTDTDRPQRKKSTIRSALGKLFGRKKKGTSQAFPADFPAPERGSTDPRQDDASVSTRPPKEGESKRSASLPITEFDRALRSHSVGPDDMVAITSARNSLQVDPALYRKRAMSSSRILSTRYKDFDGQVIGLSPRPASTHEQHDSSQALGGEDPDDIGRAITSDILTYRRKSRSLSQLNDLTGNQTLSRKRSDEIRYWRESYTPGILSPGSSAAPGEDASAPGGDRDGDEPPTDPPTQPLPQTPPRPFNFGPMTGMKITEAASLEDRLKALEVRNQKLEKVVSQLFQVIPGVNNYVDVSERAPRPAPRTSFITPTVTSDAAAEASSIYQTASHNTENSSISSLSRQSNESFGDGRTFIGSIPPSTRPAARPLSNSTVRGATSLPTLLREDPVTLTAEHYTTLKALLDTERDARQVLEDRVTKLTHRLNLSFQTPQRLDTATTYSTVSAFDHDDDDDEPRTTEADSESDAYKTPREEHPSHGFGAFGEELREEEGDGSRKKAARTLSLSQMTLKRPLQAQPKAGVDV